MWIPGKFLPIINLVKTILFNSNGYCCRITEYEACERLQRDIQSQIVQRDQQPINSQEYNRISGTVRVRLKQFANELEQLKIRLDGNKFSMNM